MGMGKRLSDEIVQYGILAMVIVIVLIVLAKFKTQNVGNSVCGSYYNATLDKCCTAENFCNAGNQSDLLTVGSTIDLFITGLSEPANWIAIIIIAIIGFFIIRFMKKKTN